MQVNKQHLELGVTTDWFLSRQHIKKQRHHVAKKVHIVKAMVFSVVMYSCKSWTIQKAEHQRNDAFKLWC